MTDERTPTPRVDASPLACDATATGELAMSTPLIARGDTAVQAPTLTGRAPADDVPESPARIGRFVVLGRLGEGGMGTVFSAYDNDLDRKVAIKLVRPTLRERFGSRARVLREAQAMARISHPNVVQIYEVGEYERLVYVAMEFVKGETLGAWIERGGPRSRQELLDAFIAAARGLAAAHAAGVVHRDFKPDNVLIGEDGRVLVVDFGIARAPAEGERDASATRQPPSGGSVLATPLTATGALMGTPAYMSPEQYRGAAVDARADQFSLCVTLYEALHGQRPFAGDTVSDLMTSVLTGALREPPRERRAPEWLLQVLRRGLSVEPGERFPDMEALIDALLRDPARARLALARRLALALGVVALLGGALWWTIRWRAEARRADAARIEARRHEALARAEEARAQGERDAAYQQARIDATRARDIARVLAADDQLHDPTAATALLLDVEDPGRASGFSAVAVRTLQEPIARAVLDEHGDQVMFVAFSPDGRQLATASFDGTTRISPTDGEGPSLVLRGHEDRIYTAAFSRDGARLVTASRDRTARVWELAAAVDDAVPATVLEGHRD
ncbi:MAG: serine/threonine-protein kinase, partial [Nannocystaceae bacterium]